MSTEVLIDLLLINPTYPINCYSILLPMGGDVYERLYSCYLRNILTDNACSSFQTVCANFIRPFKKPKTLVPLFCAHAHKVCADSKGKKL